MISPSEKYKLKREWEKLPWPQIAPNFKAQEFVSRYLFKKYGKDCRWWINFDIVWLAQFYKEFFLNYYTKKTQLEEDPVINVLIYVNTWHTGGIFQNRGVRLPNSKTGASLSQHKFKSAFDCEIILIHKSGKREEVNYKEIHEIIHQHERIFLAHGLTSIESTKIAPGWLHSDVRWIANQEKIFVFGA